VKVSPKKSISHYYPAQHGGLFSIKNPDPEIIDFSSNVNPLGPPALVKKTLKKELNLLSVYPDSDSYVLKKNLKWYTGISTDQIVIGNGATEIIYNFCQAFLDEKTPVLIPIPTFAEYEMGSKLNDCKISFFKTFNLNDKLNNFLKKIPKNGCIFVCNPNNPTGVLISKQNLTKIIKAALKKSTLVFVDECFMELADRDESIIKGLKKFENLFVLRSLTKSFGLAGIRIGYGMGSKKIISILNRIKTPWNVSGLAQKAAGAALCHHFHLDKSKKLIKKEKIFLRKSISKLENFSCNETSTNFILVKSKIKSKTVQQKLLKKKILVRDCSSFRGLGKNYIRIAVKTRKENLKLVKSLERI